MTVSELIEALKAMPQDAVVTRPEEMDPVVIERVSEITLPRPFLIVDKGIYVHAPTGPLVEII